MKCKLIFDTETTGLNACDEQIAQLSYIIINEKYEVKNAKNFYFSVDYMSAGASRVNGLSEDILNELSGGKKFKDFADEIYQDFINADVLIAHNLEFDLGFIEEEFERLNYNIDKLNKDKKYLCTMQTYTMLLQIEHEYYIYKYPKLSEVMSKLKISSKYISGIVSDTFRVSDNKYHDARFDVIATFIAYKSLENVDKIE